jgi:hypothetical protein
VRHKAAVLLVVLGLFAGTSYCTGSHKPALHSEAPLALGTTELSIIAGNGSTVELTLEVQACPPDWPFNVDLWSSSHAPRESPLRVFRHYGIRFGDRAFDMPLASYIDLPNPNRASIASRGDSVFVLLTGNGDGLGYAVKWVFVDAQLRTRQVASTEFPDELWQETRYSWPSGE